MFDNLVAQYHLHPIVDHFTIALLAFGVGAQVAASILDLLPSDQNGHIGSWQKQLSDVSMILILAGAAAAIGSYFSGDAEADRLWDGMSPQAQQILAASGGATQFLSHAVLGKYLMWTFILLAAWRIAMQLWAPLAALKPLLTLASVLALAALLYQGKTGGDLVYGYGVGTSSAAGSSAKVSPAQKSPD